MKIFLRLLRDSNNSYPRDNLELARHEDRLELSISGGREDRVVEVSLNELRMALVALSTQSDNTLQPPDTVPS